MYRCVRFGRDAIMLASVDHARRLKRRRSHASRIAGFTSSSDVILKQARCFARPRRSRVLPGLIRERDSRPSSPHPDWRREVWISIRRERHAPCWGSKGASSQELEHAPPTLEGEAARAPRARAVSRRQRHEHAKRRPEEPNGARGSWSRPSFAPGPGAAKSVGDPRVSPCRRVVGAYNRVDHELRAVGVS